MSGLLSKVDNDAGDRVVADPLCKPFSMGRNLFCVHSRKRMDDIPELKAEKMVHSPALFFLILPLLGLCHEVLILSARRLCLSQFLLPEHPGKQ